jgi:hypothetical protein
MQATFFNNFKFFDSEQESFFLAEKKAIFEKHLSGIKMNITGRLYIFSLHNTLLIFSIFFLKELP